MGNYDDYFNDRNNNQKQVEVKKSKKETKKDIQKVLKFLPKLIIPILVIVGLIIAGKFAYNFFFSNTVDYLFFEEATSTMRTGTTQDVIPVVISKNGTGFNASLAYSSSNQSVATVDENGVVTAHTVGSTKIKVKDNLSAKETEMTLNVVANKVELSSITLDKETINIYLNQERFLGFSYNPTNTTERGITLTSSDPNKVSVNGKKIKGESYGSSQIKVISPSGAVLKTVTVNVIKDNITSLTIEEPNLLIKKGKKDTIKFTYQSTDNSTLVDEEIYAMDNEYITVSGKTVQANKIGATDVYVKLGKQIQKFTVNVIENDKEIKSIKIKASATTLKVSESVQLSVEYTPSDAEEKGITWKSSDESVAKVDSSGKVTGVKAGSVTITATTKNGKTESQTLTVQNRYGGDTTTHPTFFCSGSTLQVGKASTLKITSGSLNILSQSVYTNTCQGKATITSNVVTGISSGSCLATYMVSTTSGNYLVSCSITIY